MGERKLSLARQGALTNSRDPADPRLEAVGYGSYAGFADDAVVSDSSSKRQSPDRRWNILYRLRVRVAMATETTYTQARANLKALLDEAVDSREPVIIHRREGGDVALIAVAELRGLIETAHLLRSPKNAERLLRAR